MSENAKIRDVQRDLAWIRNAFVSIWIRGNLSTIRRNFTRCPIHLHLRFAQFGEAILQFAATAKKSSRFTAQLMKLVRT